jgi:hypothetical protein
MMLGVVVLLLIAILPGLGLARILDGSADRTRRFLLAPALGLLLVFGVSGLYVLITQRWTWLEISLCILLVNLLGLYVIRHRVEETAEMSPWLKLEAAMGGEVIADEVLDDEATTQRWIQDSRSTWFYPLLVGAGIIALLPLVIFERPMGVDWIGFSVLTDSLVSRGTLELPSPSQGYWTYPPALPSLSAWLATTLAIDAANSVMQVGQTAFLFLLLGLAGAGDRHGCGPQLLLAMGLGAGIFAKVHDSGWPTVASLLGLVVGLLILLRPSATRGRHHTFGFVAATISVALIHPTGAIYLSTLMVAHIAIGRNIDADEGWQRLIIVSASIITIAIAFAMGWFAPRLFDVAVLAEYGWQGGRPLLVYSGFLLIFGLIAAWKLRDNIEAKIITLWLGLNWLLTFVHLTEGLEQIPIASLLSLSLYSMGLHAFHIPLAVLVGLWWSQSTSMRVQGQETKSLLMIGADPHCSRKISILIAAIALIQIISAQTILVMLKSHEELYALSDGDIEIQKALAELPDGSIIYNENAHWGHVWHSEEVVKVTAVPTLGLLKISAEIHPQITSAILNDEIKTLRENGITHAISSPLGTIGWVLAASPWWQIILDEDGARLWRLRTALAPASESEFIAINNSDCDCEMRIDQWSEHRFQDPFSLGDMRLHLRSGQLEMIIATPASLIERQVNICLVYESIGENNVKLSSDIESVSNKRGWNQICLETSPSHEIKIEISVDVNSGNWVNPLGLSGRSDRIFDTSAARLHWIELRPLEG